MLDSARADDLSSPFHTQPSAWETSAKGEITTLSSDNPTSRRRMVRGFRYPLIADVLSELAPGPAGFPLGGEQHRCE